MDEFTIARSLLLRLPRTTRVADALTEWAGSHLPALIGDDIAPPADWPALRDMVAGHASIATAVPPVLTAAGALAELLGLDPRERRLLLLLVACDRLPRIAALAEIAARVVSLPILLGELAGAETNAAEALVRGSQVFRLGLVGFATDRQGQVSVDLDWTLTRLLDRAMTAGDDIVPALVGARQPATLALADFAHVADAELLVRLLAGAAGSGTPGINVLIHGPAGTGKTELARTLAAAAGLTLHAIGETDNDGDEPTRWDRVTTLGLAQRLLGRRRDTVLLFDEMEDLIGDAAPSSGDWQRGRQGSKVFVNRLLESNAVPVIWTSNAIGNVEPAILRRMSHMLHLDLPPRSAGQRILARIAADEGLADTGALAGLVDSVPQAATVLRNASRVGRLTGGDGGASARSLLRALRGGDLLPARGADIDLDLFETERDLGTLFDAIRADDAGTSLLLTGPPGTGKTALAHHLARHLDRPLLVRRASDLLSRWVGETEQAIAAAFARARREGAVLLLDEVDSLLFDRQEARMSWEVTQVNELLTWLDHHPLPVVAATNHGPRLDPAALRRFLWKLELRPLGPAKAAAAFRRLLGLEPPAGLAALSGLTPGDFALVARQRRHAPTDDAGELVRRLAAEIAHRPGAARPIGFGIAA